jgi:hypothetical protein
MRAIVNTAWGRVLQSAAINGDRPTHAFQLEQPSCRTNTSITAAAAGGAASAASATDRPARTSRQRNAISYAEHLSDTASEASDDNNSPSAVAAAAAAGSNNNSVTLRDAELTSHALHAEAARKRAAIALTKRSTSAAGRSSSINADTISTVMQPAYKRPRMRTAQTTSTSTLIAAATASAHSTSGSAHTSSQQYQQQTARLNGAEASDFIQSIVNAAARGTSTVVALLPRVSQYLTNADAATLLELLAAGLLTALKSTLKLALSSDVRCTVLRLLLPLPVNKEQIKESGLGKLLVEEASQNSNSSDEMKALVRRVILNWR